MNQDNDNTEEDARPKSEESKINSLTYTTPDRNSFGLIDNHRARDAELEDQDVPQEQSDSTIELPDCNNLVELDQDGNLKVEEIVKSYGKTDLNGDIIIAKPEITESADSESGSRSETRNSSGSSRAKKSNGGEKKPKKKRNPFISFFLSMYSRRPKRRAADVARQAGRQWYRMPDWKKNRIAARLVAEDLDKTSQQRPRDDQPR